MPKRNILVLDHVQSPWREFLEEFFEDTPSELKIFSDTSSYSKSFDAKSPDIVFIRPTLLNRILEQKLKALKLSSQNFRILEIKDKEPKKNELPFDACFDSFESLSDFQRKLVALLPMPPKIKVLIVDDEPEIGCVLRDYLTSLSNPRFDVDYVENGKDGLAAIKLNKPDVLILDMKMPIMTGQEVYRQIRKQGLKVAVIAFFDAITGNEIIELHQWGSPSVVDKGSDQSSMPEMAALIKKMAYFA